MILDLKRLGYVLVVPELKHLLVDLSVRLKAANEVLQKQTNKQKNLFAQVIVGRSYLMLCEQ